MAEVLMFGTILAPIITAVLQALKTSIALPKNIIPLLALVIGLVIGFLANPFTDLSTELRLWAGGLAGLSSVGLFELVNPRSGTSKE